MVITPTKKIFIARWFVIPILAIFPVVPGKAFPQPATGSQLFKNLQKNYREVHLVLTSTPIPNQVKSGGLFNLYVQVSLPQGWHIYSLENRKNALRTSIKLNNIPFLTQGEWKESPPRITMDRVLQEMVKAHETIAGFTLGLKVPGSMVPGTFLISGILKYRLCDNRVCLQPKELPFQTNIRVVSMGEGAKVQ